jgi:type III secretion protein N (ATPase)
MASLSRVMPQVTDRAHMDAAGHVRRLLARHREIETLLQLGEYRPGGDPVADEAVRKIDAIKQFLCQRTDEFSTRAETLAALHRLLV